MGVERKKGGRGSSASFWHTGSMQLFFEFKEIEHKCFKILEKNIWMKTTVYTTIVQNCNTDSLYSVPDIKKKKKTDLGA
jgi:hypothetical protein